MRRRAFIAFRHLRVSAERNLFFVCKCLIKLKENHRKGGDGDTGRRDKIMQIFFDLARDIARITFFPRKVSGMGEKKRKVNHVTMVFGWVNVGEKALAGVRMKNSSILIQINRDSWLRWAYPEIGNSLSLFSIQTLSMFLEKPVNPTK